LPGASRQALSYLLMGALRGWGDRDHDGRVTASEAAAYVELTLRVISPPSSPRPSVSASSELVCTELTTLSVAREPAPDIRQIAPRAPLGPHADSQRFVAALEAIHAVDAQLAASRAAGSLKGEEVEAALHVRLEQAKRLGGPQVREAAPLLVEAGRLALDYGQLDEGKRILTSVLEARCGADAAGHQAWDSLMALSARTQNNDDTTRLAAWDCAYDEASATAIDSLLQPIRAFNGPNERARQLFGLAEQESDATVARCTWSAVAESYAQSWRSDSESASQVEPALNGAYAFGKLGRTDDAVALYQSYLTKQGGARAGESAAAAEQRRSYAVSACSAYLALAQAEPRLFPSYRATCRSVDEAKR